MQKKLIALAVAGLVSGAAFAQSNVTVYGVADGYYAHVKAGDAKISPAFNSGGLAGSRIGFQGAEDLGNGLKAVFQYELNFNLDSGKGNIAGTTTSNAGVLGNGANGISSTRQSYVGLAGSFGTAVLGRLQGPGYYVSKYDALVGSQISPQQILSRGIGSTISPNDNARFNNAVAYITPTISGFSAFAAFGAGEQATPCGNNCDKESAWGLGLSYEAGPLAVGYVHHKVNNAGTATDADIKENMLGASYDLKMVKILGTWQDQKIAGGDKNKVWQLGAVVPVGAGNIHAAYGRSNMDQDNSDSKSWTLAYTYGLSKRTTLYTGYSRTTNDDGAQIGVLNVAPGLGKKSTAFVLGVNHKF